MHIPPRLLILSTSLSPRSRSRVLCRYAYQTARQREIDAEFLDLQDHRVLPYGMSGSEGLEIIEQELVSAQGCIIGFPLYNYNMNASLKAVIERFGRTLEGKIVGLMVSAGGRSSYMSVMSIAASLMLDFRTWIVPRFVYATKNDFADGKIINQDIIGRVDQLLDVTYRTAWQHALPLPRTQPQP